MNGKNQRTILLVEDEVIIAMEEKSLLEEYGYQVIMVHSGEKAVEVFEKDHSINLILMDIDLGKGIDGTDAALKILKKRAIPIVFLSSHTEPQIVEKTEKITSYGYVVKNSGITVLDASIKMAFKLFEANGKIINSEENFHILFNENPFPTVLSEIHSGKIAFINNRFADVIDMKPEAIIGKTVNEIGLLKNPDDFIKLTEMIINRGYVDDMEVDKVYPDGSNGTSLIFMRMVTINEKQYCLTIFLDITERKLIEEALRKNEARYRFISENTIDVIWTLSFNTGKYTFVSPSIKKLRGYTQEEVMNQTMADSLTPESFQRVTRLLQEGFKKRMPGDTSYYESINQVDQPCKDGSIISTETAIKIVFDEQGQPVEIIGVSRDITEQKRIKESLLKNEQQLRIITNNIPVFVMYVDSLSLRYEFVNQGYAEAFGMLPEKIVGMYVRDVLGDEAFQRAIPYIERARSGKKISYENMVPIRGDNRWFNINYIPEFDEHGLVKHIVVATFEITERKKIEIELNESKLLFHQLIESLPQNIYAKDLDGRFLFANQHYCETEKKSLEELIGKTDFDHHPQDLAEKYRGDDLKVMETGLTIELEEEHQVIGGEKFFVRIIKSPLYDLTGQIIGTMGIFWDISERKKYMEALQNERLLLRTVIDNIPNLIYSKDMALRRTLANIAEVRFLGAESETEVLGKDDFHFFSKKDAERFHIEDRNVLQNGEVIIDREAYLTFKNGQTCWVLFSKLPLFDKTGQVIGLVGISTDITRRKQAEEEVTLKTMFLEAIVNSSIDGILVVDQERNKILQNQRSIDLWKIPPEIAAEKNGVSQSKYTTNMAKNPEQYRNLTDHLRSHPEETSRDEVELIDGTILDRYSAPLLGKDGQYYGRIWMFRDITMRKQTEQKVEALLAEKELLLKEIHHRVKNNMNTIFSLLSLQSNGLKNQEAAEALKDAGKRVLSMQILYDKLYRSSGFMEISIKEYLEPLIEEITGLFPNRGMVKIETQIDDFKLGVGVLSPLGMLINELVTNIMKYAFTGTGSFTGRNEGLIKVSASIKDRRVRLIISDNGSGIPENIDFENSTGFGLRLVGMLVKQLNAIIRIEREEGTRIILEFEDK